MPHSIFMLIGAIVIATLTGMLTGIFGAGGGFILTPALMIFLGIDPAVAVGTSVAVILCTSSLSLIRRRGSGTLDMKLAVILSLGTLAGVLIGKHIMLMLERMPSIVIRGRELPADDFILYWCFFGLLVFIAWYLWFDYRRNRGKVLALHTGWLHKLHFPPMLAFKSLEQPLLSVPGLLLLGLIVGIMTGLLGIGGGVIWLPALVYIVGQRTVRAAGTSLILVWISTFLATGLYIQAGFIDPWLWLILTAGGLVGAWFGTHLGLRLAELHLRLYFVYVVALAAAAVGIKIIVMIV